MVDIKKILKNREESYVAATTEIVSHFYIPLKNAIVDEVYDGADTEVVIQNISPIPTNMNFVNIVLRAACYSIGDVIDVRTGAGDELAGIKIDKTNFWELADRITLNIPVSVLEDASQETISSYLAELEVASNYDVEDESYDPEEVPTKRADKFDIDNLDETQKALMSLHKKSGIH